MQPCGLAAFHPTQLGLTGHLDILLLSLCVLVFCTFLFLFLCFLFVLFAFVLFLFCLYIIEIKNYTIIWKKML